MEIEDILEIGIGIDDDIEMSDDELKKELQLLDKEEEEKTLQQKTYKNGISTSRCDTHNNKDNEKSNTNFNEDECNKKDMNKNKDKKDYKDRKHDEKDNDKDYRERKHDEKDNDKDYRERKHGNNDEDALVPESDFAKRTHVVQQVDMFKQNMIDFRRLDKYLDVSKHTDSIVVAREITYRLQEPKINLFRSMVRVLGVKLCLEIFEETKKIVHKGGLKTDDGKRKRSPGGTFIYLMKSRGYASDSQIKEIFSSETEKKKEMKKAKNRRRNERKRLELEENSLKNT